jgi:hypothetical protein
MFKRVGFRHYDRMQPLMGKLPVRGKRAFRPSQQSRGAIANMPPPSSVPSRKGGRAKKKGKERGREQEQAPDDNGDTGDSSNDQNSHNRLSITIPPPSTVILPPSPVPTSTVPSSTSASISSASSSKRKSSALDEGSSLQSASASLAKKQKSRTSVSAIDGVKDGLNNISSSIRDMTSERKFR